MSTKNKATVTEHSTQVGDILFMAAARPLTNQKTGKTEYSIKVRLKSSDPAVKHLGEVAEYKVDTKTNRAGDSNSKVVNFTTSSEINGEKARAFTVTNSRGEELDADSTPFFDGRTDTGTATVKYKVIDYGNNKIVRLSGIQLHSLNLAPREPREPREGTVNELKSQIQSN